MGEEGSVVIGVNLDISEAEKEISKLKGDIDELKAQIKRDEEAKIPLLEQLEEIGAKLDEAKAKYAQMREAMRSGQPVDISEMGRTAAEIANLQGQYDDIYSRVQMYDSSLRSANFKLERMTAEAEELSANLAQTPPIVREISKVAEEAQTKFAKITRRISGLTSRILFFSVIMMALRSFRSWIVNVVKSNDEAVTSIARLKGALLTLVQPLVNVVIPAFITFVNVLTRIVTVLADLMARLFGSTIEASAEAAEKLNNETDAIKGVGGAAKKSSKQLLKFDEINQLSDNKSSGGGGSSSSDIKPMFDFDVEIPDWLNSTLDFILDHALAIGAALATWKIASSLGLGLNMIVGLIMAVAGAIEFVKAIFDAWVNGINWDNFTAMLISVGLVAGGLALAFGDVAGAIALVIGGIAMVVVAMKEWIETGEITDEALATLVTGIMLVGIAIALLTGSWIPLVVAAVAGLVAVIIARWDEISAFLTEAWEAIKEFFSWIVGVIAQFISDAIKAVGDFFARIGKNLADWWTGIKNRFAAMLAFILRIWQSIKDGVVKAWQGMWDGIKGFINKIFEGVETWLNGIIEKINVVLGGLSDVASSVGGLIGMGDINLRIPTVKLPRLATGTVIPPNKEFAAVLGDQKSGTNIEAPLDTIVQAFRTVLNEQGGGRQQTIQLVCDRRVFAELTYDMYNLRSGQLGVKLGGGAK